MDLMQVNASVLRSLKGADQAEAYSVQSRTLAVYVDDGRVSNVEMKHDRGISVRVQTDGRSGSASATLNDDSSAPRCAARAVQSAKHAPKDSSLRGFSMPAGPSRTKPRVHDRCIAEATAEDIVGLVECIVAAAAPATVPRALLRVAEIRTAVSNSNGVETLQESTLLYGHFTSMVTSPHAGEGVEALHSNHLDVEAAKVGSALSEKARNHANALPFHGNEAMDMILMPSELADMTLSSMGSALNGENVVLGRSPWKGLSGRQVASAAVTVTDDPSSPSLLSGTFDDEGTPMRRRVLIEDGLLRGFMFDCYNGDSTGNAFRREPSDPQGSYRLPPRIGPANLRISPGDIGLEEMVAETENGILVERLAWPEADPMTGRFGLELRCGHIVRGGEVVGTVKNALLAGDMFSAWRSVRHIGRDVEKGARTEVPPVSFADARLVGV